MNKMGMLYIISTPIGNKADFSFRAVDVLNNVDLIAAEDTRVTKKLLAIYKISKKVISCHEFNEALATKKLLSHVGSGGSIAYMVDAGTPLISDPGYVLVNKARELGIDVIPIPGPCAAITALSVSGLPTDRFAFEGFLPAKSSQRRNKLNHLISETRTMIFYESSHRILSSLQDFEYVFAAKSRTMVIAKELTKKFESVFSGSISDCIDWLNSDPVRLKGEFVLLISGEKSHKDEELTIKDLALIKELAKDLPLKRVSEVISKYIDKPKNVIYKHGLNLINGAEKE